MTPIAHILLFSSSPQELGWTEIDVSAAHAGHLADAMMWDLADRCAAVRRFQVSVYCAEGSDAERMADKQSRAVCERQPARSLHSRIMEAVREIYQREPSGHVVVVAGRNPLYPVSLLTSGVSLLGQEEEIVVFDATSSRPAEMKHHSLMWLATNSYRSELLETAACWTQGGEVLYHLLRQCRSLCIQLSGEGALRSWNDVGRVFHETQRQVLLKRWYPRRTFEILSRFERQGILQEART